MFEKIRRRVANSTWNDFLKVLMLYVDNIISEQDLLDLVSCVIGTASNDLVSLFDDFMRRCVTQHQRCEAHSLAVNPVNSGY
jgi:histone deacetylase complex regulatory component SIN3